MRPPCFTVGVAMVATLALGGCSKKSASSNQDAKAAKGAKAARGAKAKPAALSLGIAIPSYVHAVAWIGADKGFFGDAKPNPLAVKVQVMGGSAATMRGLIAGSIDVGIAGGDAVLKARAAGAELVVLAGLVDRFYHRLVARKAIKDGAALSGKRIGLPFLGGPQDMAVRVALKQLKLRYGTDVKVLSLGKEFNRMAALQKGEIDATTSQTPPSQLAKLGLHVLADLPADDRLHFPYAVLVTKRETLSERRGALESLLGGLCEAIRFYKDRRNKPASLAVIAKRIGAGADTSGATAARYEVSGPRLLSFPPRPTEEAFETVRSFLGKKDGPRLTPAKVFDLALLKKLTRDGGACDPARLGPGR